MGDRGEGQNTREVYWILRDCDKPSDTRVWAGHCNIVTSWNKGVPIQAVVKTKHCRSKYNSSSIPFGSSLIVTSPPAEMREVPAFCFLWGVGVGVIAMISRRNGIEKTASWQYALHPGCQ
jgi:hypothetical protein